MNTSSRIRALVPLAALWLAPTSHAIAQWTVTMRAMQDPLSVGQCTGIEVTLADERGFPPLRPDKKQASGWDFDLEFTAASPDAFAWRDERHRLLCANAPTAPFAVVVARYPGHHLKPTERVPGLVLERAIQVTMQGAPAIATASAQTGYPAGTPAGLAPSTPAYETNGYPPQPTQPSGYPGSVYPSPGSAPAYPASSTAAGGPPGVDPAQGYSAAGAPAYPGSGTPNYPPQQGYSSPTVVPQQAPTGYPTPTVPVSQTVQPAPGPQTAATQPAAQPRVRSFRQLFKKIGDHARQQARDVAGNTVNYTADAANSVVDNTLTSGSDLIKSNVQSTAGGIGGVGKALFDGVNSKEDPQDLPAALSAGRVVLHEIRFQDHSATLDPSSGPLLAKLAQALLATPGQYLIEGHVEKIEETRAQALSDQRAAAVKNALVSSGVPSTQLVAIGYGATRSLGSGSSARIEIARTQ
jgi:outer membrane protein OmpA-like peptidoglycan-associated protein